MRTRGPVAPPRAGAPRSPGLAGGALLCVCVLLSGCAHVDEAPTDPTLDRLERAYATLRSGGPHERARRDLERAAASFEDLALPGTSLEEALASDPDKPYRGRPWERTLSLVLLAALDAERGRCDLAVPSLKTAALLDLRSARGEASDAPVVYALLLRCLHEVGAPPADLERARAELQSSLALAGSAAETAKLDAAELERRALAPTLLVALDGDAPTLAPAGQYGESAILRVDATEAARPQVARARPAPDAVVLRLGKKGSRQLPQDAEGWSLWSSARQAGTIGGRPFDEVLRERARLKGQAMGEGQRLFDQGVQRVRDPRGLPGAAATAAAGLGLFAAGAVLDARADTRTIAGLFGRVLLLEG